MRSNNIENILVTGANGQLGSEIRKVSKGYSQWNFFFHDVNTLNITDKTALQDFIKQNKITSLINCAAYTKVDEAESELELSNSVNHLAVQNIAEISKENRVKLIHISTDYVFKGNAHTPYLEEDSTDPVNAYGWSKLQGEQAMRLINPKRSIIIRTSWVYSQYGHNFVKTMRRLFQSKDSLSVVYDQIGTPTYAKDLAEVILTILPQINNNSVEVYHYSNEGVSSWFDFAKAILEIENFQCDVHPIRSEQYPTIAARPRYSVLDKSKIKEHFKIEIPYWRASLELALSKMKED
jgi:dTDP-4-dehydrorhamnose reductase